jgi:hypothetical protein
MPDPNVGQTIAHAWEAVVGTKPEDNIHNDYWLLNRFQEGGGFKSIDGGRSINGSIEYAINTTVKAYTDLDLLDTTRVDVFDEFSFAWKEYAGTVVMSELERAKNQGSGRKFALLDAKLENLRNTFKRVLNTDMFGDGTGTAGKVIGGLAYIVSSTPATGTVGGISRSAFSFWRNNQSVGTKTTTAYDNLQAAMRHMYNLCSNGVTGAHPGFAVTDMPTFEGFESLLTKNERYNRESKSDKGLTGFQSDMLQFKDIPISYDVACPTGNLYMLNTTNLKLAYQAGYWMKGFPSVDPANQTADIFKVMTICNLYSNNPRRLGVITAIN